MVSWLYNKLLKLFFKARKVKNVQFFDLKKGDLKLSKEQQEELVEKAIKELNNL